MGVGCGVVWWGVVWGGGGGEGWGGAVVVSWFQSEVSKYDEYGNWASASQVR